jgi:hypothetical protein
MMKIKCTYKAQTVNITKDNVGYHCPIVDSVNGDFTFNDPFLENLVKKYKNFVDKRDRVENDYPYNMSLEVNYKGDVLHIDSYNPHTVVVKKYRADANFTPKLGTLNIDKLVDQFVDFVNKEEEKDMKPENKLYTQYQRQLERLRNEIEEKDYDVETIEKKIKSIFDLYGHPLGLTSEKMVKQHLFSVYKVK